MSGHATSEATSVPTGHQTERRVKRLPDAKGRNSRNSAPSTGRLPPMPSPVQAYKAQAPIQLGAPPAANPNCEKELKSRNAGGQSNAIHLQRQPRKA